MTRWPALGALLLGLPACAAAQDFNWRAGALARWEYDSNPALAAEPAGGGQLGRATASLALGRETEASRTGLDLEFSATEGSRRGDRGSLGRAWLQQRYSAALDTWNAAGGVRRERNLDSTPRASDVALGRTQRLVEEANLAWTHRLSERLSAQAQWQASQTHFDAALAGSDYRVASTSASLQHAWSEAGSVQFSLGRTTQRRDNEAGPVRISNLRLTWSQALDERWKAALSLGTSQTTRTAVATRTVCPLPASFCGGGLVRPITVREELSRRSTDRQFSAELTWRWAEGSDAAFNASRALNPGALGVTQEDTASLAFSSAWSERMSLRAALDLSRSQRPAALTDTSAGVARLGTWSLGLSQRLDPHWQLDCMASRRLYDMDNPQARARSTRFSITLQYLGPTVSRLR